MLTVLPTPFAICKTWKTDINSRGQGETFNWFPDRFLITSYFIFNPFLLYASQDILSSIFIRLTAIFHFQWLKFERMLDTNKHRSIARPHEFPRSILFSRYLRLSTIETRRIVLNEKLLCYMMNVAIINHLVRNETIFKVVNEFIFNDITWKFRSFLSLSDSIPSDLP